MYILERGKCGNIKEVYKHGGWSVRFLYFDGGGDLLALAHGWCCSAIAEMAIALALLPSSDLAETRGDVNSPVALLCYVNIRAKSNAMQYQILAAAVRE